MHDFIKAAESGELVVIDGGTGTELERRGAPMNEKAWSAKATLSHPDLLREIHEDYIRAGAEMVIANTFPASRHVLEQAGLGSEFPEINRRAVEIAREAARNTGGKAAVAGSISTTTFSGTGALDYERLPREREAHKYYLEHAEILAEAGADLIVLEMMRDVEQTCFALRASVETGLPVWVGFSCEAGDGGELLLYGGAGSLVEAVAAAGSLRPHAMGVMHSQMEITTPAVEALVTRWSGPTFAYPHRGVFEMPNWRFIDTVSPSDFADAAVHWFKAGATAIGGCCGIGPKHIRELSESLPARLRGVC